MKALKLMTLDIGSFRQGSIEIMESFVFLAILAIFLFAMTTVLTKFLIKELGGPFRFLTIQLSFGLIFITLIFFFFSSEIINYRLFEPQILISYSLSVGFAYLGFISLMIGLSKGNASVGGIFLSSRLIVNIPLAVLFLGEIYPFEIYFLIVLTLFGALIATWEKGMSVKDVISIRAKGVPWYITTMVLWALSNLFVTGVGSILTPLQFLAYRQFIFVIISWITYPFLHQKLDQESKEIKVSLFKLLIPYILLTISAQIFFIGALQHSLTITEGIGAAEGVMTFIITLVIVKLVGNNVLDEEMDIKILKIRFIGVVLSTIGVIWIALIF